MIPLWRLHARLGVRQRPHFGGRRLLQGYVGYRVCWHRFPAQLGRSEDWGNAAEQTQVFLST